MNPADNRGSILLSPQDLSILRDRGAGTVVIIDIRSSEDAAAREAYGQGHIPGAVFASAGDVFAGRETAHSGSQPLPEIAALERSLVRWGIGPETEVVIYGDKPSWAARGWWVLRWAGLKHVRLLDGGLRAWIAAGYPLEQGDPVAEAQPDGLVAPLSAGHLPSIDYDALSDFTSKGLLIDVRPAGTYGAAPGRTHIPGAVNIPAQQLWDEDEKLIAEERLREVFQTRGVLGSTAVAAYCGGGVLAAYEVLALKTLGVDAALYVGSWSQWSKRNPAGAAAVVSG